MSFGIPWTAIDRSCSVPLYLQVAWYVEEMIEAGELVPGTSLEDEVVIGDRLGVSRSTVRQAVRHLVGMGLLRRGGGGNEIVRPPAVRRMVALTSLYDDLERTNRRPGTKLLALHVVPAPEVAAAALALPTGVPVMAITRVRYAENEPLAVLRNYLPRELVEIEPESLTRRGLYQLLREAGVRPRIADQSIGARAASAEEAGFLDETTGAVLLVVSRTTSDYDGRVIEFGNHVYRASRYSFELRLVAQ